MQYILTAPQRIDANISLPASKSISNRALIINSLSGGGRLPENLSDCDDTTVIARALNEMPEVIDIGAAGTAMRFLTAYLSCTPGTHVLTGTERMQQRPIKVLVDALRYLGANIEYLGEEGFPPLRIEGRALEGGKLEITGGVSSQYVSALLMIGTVLRRGLELKMIGKIASRPYIDLTLWTMREFGADAEWTDIDTIRILPGAYRQREYMIENDWSAASYWYEMLALSQDTEASVRLSGLTDNSKQGDSVVRHLFSLLGVKTVFEKDENGKPCGVRLKRLPTHLPRLEYDFINSPDLAQTLVVCCTMLGVPFRFKGLESLRIKETDRIEALKTELRKLGYVLNSSEDGELTWDGERCRETGEPVETYGDHRMALAFAPVAMVRHEITINDPGVVSKSYPRFWDDLSSARFNITER